MNCKSYVLSYTVSWVTAIGYIMVIYPVEDLAIHSKQRKPNKTFVII